MHRIVDRVDQIMCCARVLRMLFERFLHERGGSHVRRHIATGMRGAEQCEGVEAGCVDIVRIGCVELFHR